MFQIKIFVYPQPLTLSVEPEFIMLLFWFIVKCDSRIEEAWLRVPMLLGTSGWRVGGC